MDDKAWDGINADELEAITESSRLSCTGLEIHRNLMQILVSYLVENSVNFTVFDASFNVTSCSSYLRSKFQLLFSKLTVDKKRRDVRHHTRGHDVLDYESFICQNKITWLEFA